MADNNQNQNLYERIDNSIMKGVNAGVRAWNWSTGRTRAELASGLGYIGAVALPLSLYIDNYPISSALNLAILWSAACIEAKRNKRIDEREVAALNKGCADIKVENYKQNCKKAAYHVLSASPLLFLMESGSPGRIGGAATIGLTSLSYQVMRADYLPPRKDCVRRGLDKLVKMAKKIELPSLPNPFPQPVPVPVSYRGAI